MLAAMNTVSANMKLKPESLPVTRRRFLGVTATAVAGISIVPRHVLGGPKFVSPSEKVNIAIVGCGGQGRTNVRALFNEADAQIIAVADPIESFSLEGFYYKGLGGRKPVTAEIEKHYSEKAPNYRVAQYEDFRVMLEKEKSIDAVLCATPDHNHAYVTVTAMRLGKHVYCEKPLTHNIWEARFVAKVAKETGVATQMGNHGHSGEGIRQTVEWLQDGAIGQVREVHAWTRTGRWNKESPKPMPAPVPAGVNWDLWIGTRATRPYSPNYTPVTWRDYWDFGSAVIGDMSPHHLDAALWALDLAAPESVEACSAVPGDEDRFGGCLAGGRGFVHISADGDVEACPFAPFSDTNLRDSSLRDALQSELLATIRRNSDQLREGKGGCALWEKKEWLHSLLPQ